MSKATSKIPAKLLKQAIDTAKNLKQSKVYITTDGHVYTESSIGDLHFHTRTNDKQYWEVQNTEEPAGDAADELDEDEDGDGKTKAPIVADPKDAEETKLSPEDEQKMKEAAGDAGAPDPELIAKLKGVPVSKLSESTKNVLNSYAGVLGISVKDTDTKPVIAEAIFKVVNAE